MSPLLFAPAKINLFLHVVGRRANGYHELQTIFQFIDWHDELQFELTRDGSITRTPKNIPEISEQNDLTCRAAQLLQENFDVKQGVRIRLNKNIPIGAGLGGGSSDAATTLKFLNRAWGINLSDQELADIGASLGADIPVFLFGHSAWGEGIGERLLKANLPECLYLIAVPPVAVSTKEIFSKFELIESRKLETLDSYCFEHTKNDLEAVACGLYPQVQELLETLREYGQPRMSGSGGAVFLKIGSESEGRRIAQTLGGSVQSRICTGFNVHPMTG